MLGLILLIIGLNAAGIGGLALALRRRGVTRADIDVSLEAYDPGIAQLIAERRARNLELARARQAIL